MEDSERRELGRAVAKALDALPVSRRDVARRIGVSHTTLNRIAGNGGCTLSQARQVLEAVQDLGTEIREALDALEPAVLKAAEAQEEERRRLNERRRELGWPLIGEEEADDE